MLTSERSWQSRDGLSMFARCWSPEGSPRGLVCLTHGIDEHSGRFAGVAAALTAAGYVVEAYDLRGHGRSGGVRVYAPSFAALLDDLEDFLALARARHPGLPTFLYGHSLGGNIVVNFVLRRRPEVAGAIVTSPWLALTAHPRKRLLLAWSLDWLAPRARLPARFDLADLSRDPREVAAYAADPLVQHHATPRLFVTAHRAARQARQHAGELGLPMLLLHGDQDRITDWRATAAFAARAPALATFRCFPGGRHELHHDLDREQVLGAVVAWLTARR
ncbi:MAG: alpha/beta hydrolase [Planctomycetes bacterium]|nr:alpha/beta hydrolase [Planctomycetota bacterium]